ncbi:hypothetical protein Tco_0330039, partial [Tanacetum coccineum]
MHDPREPHLLALKRILRYVRGTLDYGLQLFSSSILPWLLIQMQIGLVVLLLGDLLLAIVCFLATICSRSPLSVNRRFLALVLRPSIGVLLMQLLRHVGYRIFC